MSIWRLAKLVLQVLNADIQVNIMNFSRLVKPFLQVWDKLQSEYVKEAVI
jgi:hypothetical protein